VVIREYVEPGVSGGSLLKRKAFRRMIEKTAERRDVDRVIVWSVSRWARNQEETALRANSSMRSKPA
jgi:DNA invertase Pin-like site-specific DNA recombinase